MDRDFYNGSYKASVVLSDIGVALEFRSAFAFGTKSLGKKITPDVLLIL